MRFVDSSANAGVLALFEATHAEKMWPVAWQAGKWGQPVNPWSFGTQNERLGRLGQIPSLSIWFNVNFVCQSWG